VGKRRKSPSKNSRPVLNFFSPKRNLFDGQCHGKSTLLSQEFVFPAISVQQRKPGNIKDKFRVYRFLSLFTQHFFDLV
jgi:hypothetical protein